MKAEALIEHSIGDLFRCGEIVLKVIAAKDDGCTGCYFKYGHYCGVDLTHLKTIGMCSADARSDHQGVIFKQA